MNREPLLLIDGTIGDRSLIDRMIAGLKAGSYAVVERRPLPNGEESTGDAMLASPDRSLPAIDLSNCDPNIADPVGIVIRCLSLERRGSDFIDRMWHVLRAVIIATPHPDGTGTQGSIHTECPFHPLQMRSWNGTGTPYDPDPDLAARIRPMVLLSTRDEMVEEAPEHVGQVVGLSCMFCYATYEDASSMETLRGLRDLDALAADPTYGRGQA